ncbi:uncharacterized protein LOC118433548 [Folsomia candida]|uniref:uncharacterized protein LOC118433548 n=1 Tax=Folsomia candida TaxID=158441 RepID=UPI001604D345|nr:uncharacterized protein LOC118433548 [Folsomia candida]
MESFEVTGDFDGSVSMICPSAEGNRSMAEDLPVINFILNDMECYSSVEITVVTINTASIESGEYETKVRKIIARNFRSRTVITDNLLKVHFKLRSSWNNAYLNLEELVRDAWGDNYLVTKMVKINANTRVRRVYFSDQVYGVEDLPKEFVVDNNPFITTAEFFTPSQQYPPDRKPKLRRLYKNLREIDHQVLTQAEYAKMMKLQLASPSEILKNNSDRQHEHIRGLLLSLTSKDGDAPGSTVNKAIRSVGMTGEQLPVKSTANSSIDLLPGNLDEVGKVDFCKRVWNENQEPSSSGGVEWDLIENFDLKPQTLAQIHRQRRGEGFYDVYNARMLKSGDDEFEELDAINVTPLHNQQDLSQKFRELLGDRSLETYMKPKPIMRNSFADPDADLDYFKDKGPDSSDGDICKNVGQAAHKCGGNEGGEDDGSDSGESMCSEDTWLLTWTFDGMDACRMKEGDLFDSENIPHSSLCHSHKAALHPNITPHRTFENENLKS